jgi:hypothetical protein
MSPIVWHVDDSVAGNSDETYPQMALVQADGLNHLGTTGAGKGDGGDPYPGTANNVTFDSASDPSSKSYDGDATAVSVTEISAPGAVMTMKITVATDKLWRRVYPSRLPSRGIGGFDLADTADRVFAYDYLSAGKVDYLVMYRPGSGMVWIVGNKTGLFGRLYPPGNPVPLPGFQGIGGYDLRSQHDKAFAFDYNSTGKLDHIVLYRPGSGACFIVKPDARGKFAPVYKQIDGGSGIGGYDLRNVSDQAFAFDCGSTGKMDHIVLFRPGKGACFVVKKDGKGGFVPVYRQNEGGAGIGGYDMKSPADRGFAFDYNSSGKQDHLVFYRPGAGAIFIIKQTGPGIFTSVYATGNPARGIGPCDLRNPADSIVPIDWNHSGKLDHLAVYRPGAGLFTVIRNVNGRFLAAIPASTSGIGPYDLRSKDDKIITFDYDHSGKQNYLLAYRPGTGTVWILKYY